MSTLNRLFDLPEQICYVQCGYCSTILLVSVPCSSLSMVVTVRCGHCANLLSVNMKKASFVPLHLLASFNHDTMMPKEEAHYEAMDTRKALERHSPSMAHSSESDEYEDEDMHPPCHVVNKPPEKRQRAPSAYNHFIKDEIRRLKAENPNMAHKEAFSTAAKNWAHFPPTEKFNHQEENVTSGASEGHVEGKDFRGRKAPRHSLWEKTPFEKGHVPSE